MYKTPSWQKEWKKSFEDLREAPTSGWIWFRREESTRSIKAWTWSLHENTPIEGSGKERSLERPLDRGAVYFLYYQRARSSLRNLTAIVILILSVWHLERRWTLYFSAVWGTGSLLSLQKIVYLPLNLLSDIKVKQKWRAVLAHLWCWYCFGWERSQKRAVVPPSILNRRSAMLMLVSACQQSKPCYVTMLNCYYSEFKLRRLYTAKVARILFNAA